jgi:NADPH:quinone reductase
MKHIMVEAHGGPEALILKETQPKLPRAGDVLVDVAAAGVNFMDTGTRNGFVPQYQAPLALGVEGAGRILALGEGVSELKIGDRVAWCFAWGSYSEQLVAPADMMVPLPDDIDFETAAGLMLQGLTASHFVFETYAIKPGDKALVHSAAGGVGLLLTQMIKLLGGTVIGRVSNQDKAQLVKDAGADEVIVSRGGAFADEVLRLTDGEGVQVVYDGSGAETFQDSLRSLDYHGTLALFGPFMDKIPAVDVFSLPKSISLTYPVFLHHIRTRQALIARSNQLFNWVREGKLKPHIGMRYPLAAAAQAHADIESRRSMGKLLLIP